MVDRGNKSTLQLAYRGMPVTVREDLLRFCGVWSPNVSENALEMARNEGRRLVGLYILQMLGEVNLPKGVL
jgi:hypothetical protein